MALAMAILQSRSWFRKGIDIYSTIDPDDSLGMNELKGNHSCSLISDNTILKD